jgi:dihydrofolate synthase/folylpolyglutamate synthase
VQLLGATVPQVAAEKAGILKRNVPAVTAEVAPAVLEVFAARARDVGTSLAVLAPDVPAHVDVALDGTRFPLDTQHWGTLDVHTPLVGAHQARNVALALTALERLSDRWRPGRTAALDGVAGVRWPGRAQVLHHAGTTWMFDVAHNTAGVQALVATVAALPLPRPLVVLAGVLGDKDWRAMLRPLQACADLALLTLPPTAPADRRWDPAAVVAAVPSPNTRAVPEFPAALAQAWRAARGGTVVVTGSFHTVGDALIVLGLAPWGADAALPPVSLAV